jgi:hypothetical protein
LTAPAAVFEAPVIVLAAVEPVLETAPAAAGLVPERPDATEPAVWPTVEPTLEPVLEMTLEAVPAALWTEGVLVGTGPPPLLPLPLELAAPEGPEPDGTEPPGEEGCGLDEPPP